jgi:ABC-type lipoprotein release transport system permease subunit
MLTQWKLILVLALVFGVAAAGYLTLVGLQEALEEIFTPTASGWLVVQEPGSFGEVYGSVLSADSAGALKLLGASRVIPVMHAITGTSRKDTRLVQGVKLEAYAETNPFRLLEGRALQPGDAPRTAMLGWRLAQRLSLESGDLILLRGRSFEVVGVFRTGSFADNEAWIPLESAQALLGLGDQVSVYLVPDDGTFEPGTILPGGLEVVRQGYSIEGGKEQYQPMLDMFRTITMALGVAAALTLTHVMLRLAWMRRRELAVLRTVGFPAVTLVAFLVTQALCILALGLVFGFGCAALLPRLASIDLVGVTVTPVYSVQGLAESLAWMFSLAVLGSVLPSWWLSRYNLASLLRYE